MIWFKWNFSLLEHQINISRIIILSFVILRHVCKIPCRLFCYIENFCYINCRNSCFLFQLVFSLTPALYTTSSLGVLDYVATDSVFLFPHQSNLFFLTVYLPTSSPSKLAYHYQVNLLNHTTMLASSSRTFSCLPAL